MSYPQTARLRRRTQDFDFDFGRKLGEGSLSQVRFAKERDTGKKLAVKIFDRNYLRSQRKDADVTMEEHCLRRANHPCIVKLHSSFSDEANRYLVIELCAGGELWELVRNGVGLSDTLARHYLSQTIEAVSYLRDARIVHRDLKAENVIIGDGGVAKLVDFGSAKDLANPHIKGAGTKGWKTTLEDNVGTPNFMAPEVINNKFSDFRSDTWSLGCMIFQVLTGQPPFGIDMYTVYKRALKARLAIPERGICNEARDLIKKMVVVDPNSRLGGCDIQDIREHQYFRPIPLATVGVRFEGSHLVRAPVPSLEDLCLRSVRRHWDVLCKPEKDIRALAESRGERLRDRARNVLFRMQDMVDTVAAQAAKSMDEAGGSGSDSSADDAGKKKAAR